MKLGMKPKSFIRIYLVTKMTLTKSGEIGSFLNEGETNYPKLTDAEAEEIEGHITADELLRTLKNTKNDTAPGSSGFTSYVQRAVHPSILAAFKMWLCSVILTSCSIILTSCSVIEIYGSVI